jgi:predicted short-subunit dehydrogenase-like oxidoreductase (DUF2520 family)
VDEDFRKLTASRRRERFSVIGAGNLAGYFLHSLAAKGYRLTGIFKKSKFRLFDAYVTPDIRLLVEESDFIVIATQESKIAEAAQMAAESSDPEGKVFFHTSNSLTSDQLAPLREKGAVVASFSPLQTFPAFKPDQPEEVFEGVYFLLEGDPRAVTMAERMAADLNANVLKVDKDKKALFHIAGVAASNFLISILKLAERQLKKTAAPGRAPDIKVLMPLIRQTLKNVENRGVEASLTGPFKRKEMGVIRKHLELLDKDDAAIYKALTDFLAVD